MLTEDKPVQLQVVLDFLNSNLNNSYTTGKQLDLQSLNAGQAYTLKGNTAAAQF
jgi:hypothetical protein